MTQARGAAAALIAGTALMMLFEGTIPRIAGVAAILSFIVLGVFAIATPQFLERDADESVPPRDEA